MHESLASCVLNFMSAMSTSIFVYSNPVSLSETLSTGILMTNNAAHGNDVIFNLSEYFGVLTA